MALGILALFLLFVVYPLVLVLYKSVLSEDGNLSFAYFTKFFARKYYWSTLVNSFKVTIVSTVVALTAAHICLRRGGCRSGAGHGLRAAERTDQRK